MQYGIVNDEQNVPRNVFRRVGRAAAVVLAAGAIASGIYGCSSDGTDLITQRQRLGVEAIVKARGKDMKLSVEERDRFLEDVGLGYLAGSDAELWTYWGPGSRVEYSVDGTPRVPVFPEDTCMTVRAGLNDYPITEKQLRDYLGK